LESSVRHPHPVSASQGDKTMADH